MTYIVTFVTDNLSITTHLVTDEPILDEEYLEAAALEQVELELGCDLHYRDIVIDEG